jgi:hypothetical protein
MNSRFCTVLISLVPRSRPLNPSPALESYLQSPFDSWLPQQLAEQSSLPENDRYRNPDYHGAPRDDNRTSMMMSGGDHSRDSCSQDLAALTTASTRSSSGSVPTSVGARQIDSQRLLETGQGNALIVPPLPAQRILECPFNFLFCVMAFSNLEEWITHSMAHFCRIGPSTSNLCCFCEETFKCSTGQQSWRERMQHVALHHRLGFKLAHARPDFELFDYLWRNKLISNADYKDLKGNSTSRTTAGTAYPSPPNSPTERSLVYTETHSHRHRYRRA